MLYLFAVSVGVDYDEDGVFAGCASLALAPVADYLFVFPVQIKLRFDYVEDVFLLILK